MNYKYSYNVKMTKNNFTNCGAKLIRKTKIKKKNRTKIRIEENFNYMLT